MPDSSKSLISAAALCLLIVCSTLNAQDTPEVPEAASISNAKPTLAELMARFAEMEAGYLPFHIEYRETGDLIEGPYKPGLVAQSKRHFQYLTQRGHQRHSVWMCESTTENEGVSRTERLLWQDSKLHRKETMLESRFFGDDFDESIERSVRPLEGIFPLLFGTKSPIRVSDHFAAAPSEFTLKWHEELARVMCHYRPKNDEHIAIELWLDPDYRWHPVFIRKYKIHTGERFPDEWKALQFLRLAGQVRVSLGEFNGPVRGGKTSTDAFSPPFIRLRFELLKSAYQDRVTAAAFSPDTPIGGSPIADLEPVGGEQIEVKSSNIAELSPPALTPEQILALAAVTNQQSSTEMQPAASMYPTSPALPDEIQSQITALEAELIVQKAELGERHPTVKKLNDKIAALREAGGELLGQVTVLHLKNGRAKDVAQKIELLFPSKTHKLVVDERTNSLMLRGDEKLIRDVEQIVKILDEDVPVAGEQVNADLNSVPSMKTSGETLPVPATRSPFVEENSERMSAVEGSLASNPPVPIEEYRRRLADLEMPVMQLAEKVRAAETSLGKDHPDAVKQRAELRALVQKTFAEQQEIQRAELAEFTRRLERMRRSIETRDKIGDKIVDRRVEVLLSAPSAHTPNSTNSFRRGNTSTTDRKDLSFIPWKVPKNSPRLEISPTAWGESVHGLRAAMAVTDGPGELAGLQQLHLVVQNLSNVPIQISDTGWSSGFQMAVHVTRSSGEQVETLRPEKKIMFAPSSSSHLLESGETVVLATALIGRGIDSNPNDSVDLLISDHRPQTTENRELYRVGTSVMVPQDAGLDKKFRLHTGKVSLEFPTIPVDKHDVAIDQRVSVPPKSEPRQTTDRGISVAEANDQTSPPQSDAEKAIARLVLVFFQDEARRAVPGLMIDHGAETLILTAGPATIVPHGVAHVKDRAYLEFPETVDVEAGFINTKTTDIFLHRAKSGLTTFKLEKTVDLEIGDGLSAILLSGEPTLRVTPEVAHISALNQATSFSLATHKFRHEFTGLIQIDQRLPEGTPLFKNGELAGITLLGTRFMKDDVQGSYVVPTSRVLEVLQQVKTK